MFKYFKKIIEINVLSYLNLSLFFLIPYIFYYTYSIKEIYAFTLLFFLFAFFCLILFFQKEIYFNLNRYSVIIIIFIVSIIISGFNNFEKNIIVLLERLWIWVCISFFIMFFIAFKKPDIKKIINFMVFFNIFIVILGLFQYFSFLNFLVIPLINTNAFNFRIYSVFGNPDNYAVYIVGIIPFLVYKYVENKKIIFLIFLVLNLISLYLTKSLSGIIGFLFQVILFFIFYFLFLKKINFKYKKLIFFLFFILVLILLKVSFDLLNKKSDSVNIRKFLWESTLLMIKDYPVFGVGAGNFRIFTPYYQGILYNEKQWPTYIDVHDEAYAHNDYLQVIAEQGIFGFLIFLLLLFYPFYRFIISFKKDFYLFFIISMSGIIIFSLFNFPFSNPFIIALYLVFGFILCNEDILKVIKINNVLRFIILFILLFLSVFNIKFIKNFCERYYLIQFFSYQLAKGNYNGVYNYIYKNKKIIKDDYQLNFYSGTALNALKKYNEAKIYFSNAIKLFPYFSSAYYNLGNSLFNDGKLYEAADIYEKLLKFNPTYKFAYNNLGTVYIETKNIKKAIEIFEKGLRFEGGNNALNFNLALCYYKLREYKKAEMLLKKILIKNADFEPAKRLAKELEGNIK